MRTVIVSTYDSIHNPYYSGGGADAIHQIARRLVSDFKVVVLTGGYPGSRDEVIDQVIYKRIGFSHAGPRTGQINFHLLLPFHAWREEYDLWIESFTPPFSTSLLPLFTRKPVIGLAHMLSAEDMSRKYKLPFFLIQNVGLRVYRHMIVITEAYKEKVRAVNPGVDIRVIPNGVDLPDLGDPQRPTPKHILYLGRITIGQKGLDLLVEAFKEACAELPYSLVIAGSGAPAEVEHLRALIEALGLSQRVHLVGRVDGEVKDALLREAAIVAIPSRYESFSLVALEAMSYGLPFVAFDIEGLRWVSEGCGLKVPAFDAPAFGQALLRLARDEGLRGQLASRGRAVAEGYSWDNASAQYKSYLEQILEGRQRA